MHVAATGPHVIAAAARHAEGVDFTVGAEPERLRWAVGTAREAAGDRELSLGAYLNVAVDPDRAAARDLVRGSTAIFARFATEGAPHDGLSEVTRAGIEQVAADYDEAHHGRAAAAHAQALGDEFIDRFAVVGSSAEVTDAAAGDREPRASSAWWWSRARWTPTRRPWRRPTSVSAPRFCRSSRARFAPDVTR